ncbi:ribosome maturation factor RimM [Sphingoaurantiacus capsulatus]|uniref:Ribosome maturation factor RimM n=1 Tax=Sphingoaurantiacus capsulatus TaxID=1771310 RepID=A0ABV7X832_9SPHN
MADDKSRVTLAAVAGAHGIGGEVRLKVFAEGLDSLRRHKTFEAAGQTLTLKSVKPGKPDAIARFAEVSSRDDAEALRGTVLTVDRGDLPTLDEGEFYHSDLIGLPAATTEGEAIGTIVAVENFGAGDILEIEKADGKRFMVPFRPEAVPEVGASVVIEPAYVQ